MSALTVDSCFQDDTGNSNNDDERLGFSTAMKMKMKMPWDDAADEQGSGSSEMILRRLRGGRGAESSRLYQSSYRSSNM